MKSLLNSAQRSNRKPFAVHGLLSHIVYNAALFCGMLMLMGLLITGCKKENMPATVDEFSNAKSSASSSDAQILDEYSGLSSQTMWELQQARAATARYRNINNAIKDGYTDINVVVQNMGHHYMKSTLVDATFDIRKPEILVYNRNERGAFELVAVEYAIPLSLSPNAAPAGFSGTQDVWDRNTGFGLWLLHAWVWSYNPNGVFNPTNPLVHLH